MENAKKLIITLVCLLFIVTMSGCGNHDDIINSPAEKMQNLYGENKEITEDCDMSSGVVCSNGIFVGCENEGVITEFYNEILFRVQDGVYVPLNMEKTYTVAGTEYVLTANGDGQTAFDGAEVLTGDGVLDHAVPVNYITKSMNGKVDITYSYAQGRIIII